MLCKDVVTFAEGNENFYNAVAEFCAKENRTNDDEKAVNEGFMVEMEAKSGVSRDTKGWEQHPSVKWAFMQIVDASLTTILPVVVTPSLNMFMDMRPVRPGDIVKYEVKPNSYYTVSYSARGERTVNRVREFSSEFTMAPYAHQITIYENYYSILTGTASFAHMILMASESLRNEMYKDALNALMAGLNKITDPYKKKGAFNPKTLVELCTLVATYNGGVKPVIAGTPVALMSVLPDSTLGYRMNVEGQDTAVSVVRDFYGFKALMLDQAAAGNNKLVLPDDKLYIISPTLDKPIKGLMVDGMSHSNDFLDNADLTKNFTMTREWNFQYLSSAKAGIYEMS